MKLRFAISRKLLLGLAGVIVLLGGGAGGSAYFGLISLPWGTEPELRGSVDSPPPEGGGDVHAEQKSPEEPPPSAEGNDHAESTAGAAHGSEGTAPEGGGGHGTAEGESGKLEGPPVVYDVKPRSALLLAVRDLLAAQSAAAIGKTLKEGSQRETISRVQLELQKFDPAKATRQDIEALGIYLLSGGNPRGLSGVIDQIPPETHMAKVIRGAHDYVVGEPDKAKELLMDLDLSSYSAAFASRLSLAQAALVASTDPVTQAKALKRAAAFAPGTLVEEAAIRRLVNLNLKSDNDTAFKHFARKYMRRFPRSLYIGEFLQNYGQGILQFESEGKAVSRDDIKRLLQLLNPELARTFLLEIGKQSTKRGLKDLCLFATEGEQVSRMLEPVDFQRAKLYSLACSVVDKPGDSLAGLQALKEDSLSPDDAALRQDAIRLSEAMLGRASAADNPQLVGPEPADPETDAIMVSAAQQLKASKELLKEALQ